MQQSVESRRVRTRGIQLPSAQRLRIYHLKSLLIGDTTQRRSMAGDAVVPIEVQQLNLALNFSERFWCKSTGDQIGEQTRIEWH